MRENDLKSTGAIIGTYDKNEKSAQYLPERAICHRKPCRSILDEVFQGICVAVFEDTGPQFVLSNINDGEDQSFASKMFVRLLAACSD
ncbi:MAG: hypothetical protein ACXAEU_07610, partial [Candidatus Hodarchaeales archaeon]